MPNAPLDGEDLAVEGVLARRLIVLRRWSIFGVFVWFVVVGVLVFWNLQRIQEDELSGIVVRTEQYRESATRIAVQTFNELAKITELLTQRGDLNRLSERFYRPRAATTAATATQRTRALRDDPDVALVSGRLAMLVRDLRYDFVYLMDRRGIVVASSDWEAADTLLGHSLADRQYFKDALRSESGQQFAVGRLTGTPGFYFSARLGETEDTSPGVVVARLPSDHFVEQLSRRRYEFIIFDEYGLVVASGDRNLILRHAATLSDKQPGTRELAVYDPQAKLEAIDLKRPAQPLHEDHWLLNGDPVVLSMGEIPKTTYRLAVFSRFYEADNIFRAHLIIGALLGLLGVPVAFALNSMFSGQVRRRAAALRLERLNVKLTEANSEKNRYLGIAAHDLRNPLSSLRGLSQLMLEMQMPNEQKEEFLRVIHRTSDELLSLVNDLLDVAQIEAGKVDLKRSDCAPDVLVRQRIQHLRPYAEHKQIDLKLALDEGPPLSLDTSRFGQVVDNLVSNAIKFSPPATTVSIALERPTGALRFVVEDQGPGISEQDRAHLFKSFQKLSARPTAGEKSTGLGLSIVKKIVEAHGGEIGVESASGGGARFVVSLPQFPDGLTDRASAVPSA